MSSATTTTTAAPEVAPRLLTYYGETLHVFATSLPPHHRHGVCMAIKEMAHRDPLALVLGLTCIDGRDIRRELPPLAAAVCVVAGAAARTAHFGRPDLCAGYCGPLEFPAALADWFASARRGAEVGGEISFVEPSGAACIFPNYERWSCADCGLWLPTPADKAQRAPFKTCPHCAGRWCHLFAWQTRCDGPMRGNRKQRNETAPASAKGRN